MNLLIIPCVLLLGAILFFAIIIWLSISPREKVVSETQVFLLGDGIHNPNLKQSTLRSMKNEPRFYCQNLEERTRRIFQIETGDTPSISTIRSRIDSQQNLSYKNSQKDKWTGVVIAILYNKATSTQIVGVTNHYDYSKYYN